MRLRLLGVAVVLGTVLGLVGFAKHTTDDAGRFSPPFTLVVTDDEGKFWTGTTDSEGKFTCTVNFANITKVTGRLEDYMGDGLAALGVRLLFESRPEVLQILGIGNIGALWVTADGHDWERIPRYSIEWSATGVSINLGSVVVTPKMRIRCQDITERVKLHGETGEYVHFTTGTCTAELWYEFDPITGLRMANKVLELPREVPRACTWVVVEKVERGQVTQTFYHSDGKAWVEKEKVVFQRLPTLPASGQHCDHVIVKGPGGKDYMYHWWQPDPSLPGRWRSLGEWNQVEVKTPDEEPSDEGGSGEPGAG